MHLYAVKNINTGKLENARCNDGGRFYSRKCFAQSRCNQYNITKHDDYKVVTFKLIEVKDEN